MNPNGAVLGRGPSDHRPFARDLWYVAHPGAPAVRTGFWNVHHGTRAPQARPNFERLIEDFGVQLLILNEVKRRSGILEMLRDDFGMRVRYSSPEFAIAVDAARFEVVRSRTLVMSEHDYWLDRNEALAVVLQDRKVDTQLKAIAQHPPAHIVRRTHPTFDNVLRVHKDVATRNARIARNSAMPVVIGRDSNIDPEKDRPVFRGDWDWAYRGFDYVRSPEATFGQRDRGRHIDELLTNRMRTNPPKETR